MSNTVITLLVVFAFAAGLGVGLVTVLRPSSAERLRQKHEKATAERYREYAKRLSQETGSTVHFGRDDNDPDHPHDIERQHAHRYDGMTDGDVPYAPYIASGLDFGREPR